MSKRSLPTKMWAAVRHALAAALALALPCEVGAVGQASAELYTVQKGDTLWTISEQHLSDPFAWPGVWQLNSRIRNPHRIYPGQSLSLPPPQVAVEVTRDGDPDQAVGYKVAEDAPAAEPNDTRGAQPRRFYEDGVILAAVDLRTRARIVAFDSGRLLGRKGETAVVDGPLPDEGKVRFYRPQEPVKNPVTGREEVVELRYLGAGQVAGGGVTNGRRSVTIDVAKVEIDEGDVVAGTGIGPGVADGSLPVRDAYLVLRKYDLSGRPRGTHKCRDAGPGRQEFMADDEILLVSTEAAGESEQSRHGVASKAGFQSFQVLRALPGFAYVLAPRGAQCVDVGGRINRDRLTKDSRSVTRSGGE